MTGMDSEESRFCFRYMSTERSNASRNAYDIKEDFTLMTPKRVFDFSQMKFQSHSKIIEFLEYRKVGFIKIAEN